VVVENPLQLLVAAAVAFVAAAFAVVVVAFVVVVVVVVVVRVNEDECDCARDIHQPNVTENMKSLFLKKMLVITELIYGLPLDRRDQSYGVVVCL
jgi:hypothetical protein